MNGRINHKKEKQKLKNFKEEIIMKKSLFKKTLATALSVVMALGSSIYAFAEGEATATPSLTMFTKSPSKKPSILSAFIVKLSHLSPKYNSKSENTIFYSPQQKDIM